MVKYIDKAAVVAEINRVLNSYDPNEITSGRYALVSLRDFLDTLEVKEEVTTTDALIDKACEWLSDNMYEGTCEQILSKKTYPFMRLFVEDFKQAMKGE